MQFDNVFRNEDDVLQGKKWVNALRSGDYKQVKGSLQDFISEKSDETGYCCLGVACKVLIPEELIERHINGSIAHGLPSFQKHSPKWLIRVQQMGYSIPSTSKDTLSLYSLNDSWGYSFTQIADLLEEKHPCLKQ